MLVHSIDFNNKNY